jgi:hypothetical protein
MLRAALQRFGELVVTPAISAIFFFLVFTPVALVGRVLRHDPLRRRSSRGMPSYWVERGPAGPMTRQY